MRCFQMCCVLAVVPIASLLPGCTLMPLNGSNVRLYVDSNMVVTDLSSNQQLQIVKDEDSLFTTYVRRGKRHALRVQRDTITTYTFLDPNRGLIGMSYDQEYLLARKEDAVLKEYQQGIEDSLRMNVVPVVPLPLIWKREFAEVNVWTAQGYGGPVSAPWIIPGPWGSVGVGISIVPWVMERPEYQANLTFYTLSAGVYSQWGRFELRHRRNTSWSSHPDIPDLSGSNFGLHYSLHLML